MVAIRMILMVTILTVCKRKQFLDENSNNRLVWQETKYINVNSSFIPQALKFENNIFFAIDNNISNSRVCHIFKSISCFTLIVSHIVFVDWSMGRGCQLENIEPQPFPKQSHFLKNLTCQLVEISNVVFILHIFTTCR